MLSDIEIAQRAEMLHIRDIAAKTGIVEDDLEYYGKYKAKLSSEAIKKAEKDLEAERNNKDIQHWEWLYKKAKAAITAHENKIERISAFIRCAKAELKKQERESEAGE